MQKNSVRIFLLAIICCTLNDCGTKGPLYIPEQRYPQASTTKPESAPNPTDNRQLPTK